MQAEDGKLKSLLKRPYRTFLECLGVDYRLIHDLQLNYLAQPAGRWAPWVEHQQRSRAWCRSPLVAYLQPGLCPSPAPSQIWCQPGHHVWSCLCIEWGEWGLRTIDNWYNEIGAAIINVFTKPISMGKFTKLLLKKTSVSLCTSRRPWEGGLV